MLKKTVFERLKELEEQFSKPIIFYVHYEPSTGKIYSVRNYFEKDDSMPFLEIKQENLPENFSMNNYFIVEKDKEIILQKNEFKEFQFKIDDTIYKLPKIKSVKRILESQQSFDILIEQNNNKKEFYIKLSRSKKEQFSFLEIKNQVMNLYVTALDDPNILYKTLTFSIADLLNHHYYTIPFEDFQGNESNIYSLKYFQNYLHNDIRNDE